MKKSELLMNAICMSSFFLSSPFRLSSASVVFDFNDSLNDFAPISPTLFPVDAVRMEKSELLMDVICAFFSLCLHNSD